MRQQIPSHVQLLLRLVGLWLWFTTVAMGVQAEENPEIAALLAQAQQWEAKGDGDEALANYKQAVRRANAHWGANSLHAAMVQHELAKFYMHANQHHRAEPLLRHCQSVIENHLGKDHVDLATVLDHLGVVYRETQQGEKSLAVLENALSLRERHLGNSDLLVGLTLHHLAQTCQVTKKMTAAHGYYQRAVTIVEARLGANNPGFAVILNDWGYLYLEQKNLPRAEPLLQRSLRIKEQALGENHPALCDTLDNLGDLYVNKNDFATAEQILRRSLRLREAALGKKHLLVAMTLSKWGQFCYLRARYEKAENAFLRALEIVEAQLGKQSPQAMGLARHLGYLYHATGNYDRAETYYKRCLVYWENQPGRNGEWAGSIHDLGALANDRADYALAEVLLQRSLNSRVTEDSSSDANRSITLGLLADVQNSLGQYERAEKTFLQCLHLQESILGKNDPVVAITSHNLAYLYFSQQKFPDALKCLQRALLIQVNHLGEKHSATADTLRTLGTVYDAMGAYQEAKQSLVRALDIYEQVFGKNSPAAAVALNSLAVLYQKSNQVASALPLFERCIKILETRFGKQHYPLIAPLTYLAILHANQKDWGTSTRYWDRARRLERDFITRVLPGLSEIEQETFLREQDQSSLYLSLAYAWQQRRDANIAKRSAGWLLNSKGLGRETLARRYQFARGITSPQVARLDEELTAIRARLARFTLTPPQGSDAEKFLPQRAILEAREQELSKALGQASINTPPSEWVELEKTRQQLPPDTVLVEFARFPVRAFPAAADKPIWEAARYAAWVIPAAGQGEVELVDLGPADALDDAIQNLRHALANANTQIVEIGEQASEKALAKPLGVLGKLLLEPLRPRLQQARHWILCPDGDLWLIPWAALPWRAGQYVVEEHFVQFVVSGRDVLPSTKFNGSSQALIVADPDFDQLPMVVKENNNSAQQTTRAAARDNNREPSSKARPASSKLVGQRPRGRIGAWNVSFAFDTENKVVIHDEDAGGAVAGEGKWNLTGSVLTIVTERARFVGETRGAELVGTRAMEGETEPWQLSWPNELLSDVLHLNKPNATRALESVPPRVRRLPGTEREARAAATVLQNLPGITCKTLMGRDASENAIKNTRQPRVVLLATHGFFLPGSQKTPHSPVAFSSPAALVALPISSSPRDDRDAQPLLRCGLLLAGCNQRKMVLNSPEDGVFTGLEIVGCDFRGTQLVVLSACDTATGQVQVGEGVVGLRHAFQLAGAKHVIATLWQINDDASAELMEDFWSFWRNGGHSTKALHQAQLRLIQKQRQELQSAHPYFWASFTITGGLE